MMAPTDMSEKGLESLIVETLTGGRELAPGGMTPLESSFTREAGYLGEQFYVQGDPKDYDREYAIDLAQLLAFLNVTQPEAVEAVGIAKEGPSRTRFLHRLQGEIAKRGVIDVLRKPEPDPDLLSNIVRQFNELWGDISWQDKDKVRKIITEELPTKVASDRAYQNAQHHSDKNAARIEHDRALRDSILAFLSDQTELFKQFQDNESFRKWLCDTVFAATYQKAAG